jgi:hypothetical protein
MCIIKRGEDWRESAGVRIEKDKILAGSYCTTPRMRVRL